MDLLTRRRLMMQGDSADGDFAVSRKKNAPVMDAFWNAYGTNGTIRAGILSNPDYILKSEANLFTGDMLNPTSGSTSSIFYAQRNNITHFEEFEYFLSIGNIPNNCFRSLTKLTSIVLPIGVTSIGESAFRDCTSLMSINIPNSVTSIGNDICQGCTSLTSFTWSPAVTTIPNGAFMNCTALVNINIPEGVTRINENGFGGCTSAATIRLPSTITYLMYRAFQNCPNVTTIYSLNPAAPTANIHAGLNITPFGSGYNGSTTSTNYVGYNTKGGGNNKLYVPSNATNYESQQGWRNPLLNPNLSNFTIVYSL